MGKRPSVNPADAPEHAISLRLDPDVLAGLRGMGSGWQTIVNVVLRNYLRRHKDGITLQKMYEELGHANRRARQAVKIKELMHGRSSR